MEKATVVGVTTVAETKWLRLQEVDWKDWQGKNQKWNCCERTTKTKSGLDAVEIMCIVKKKEAKDRMLLVKQFRPPIGKLSIEFPAGLVDEGETPEEAALRELKEETGYTAGTVKYVSPLMSYDPGCLNSVARIVHVEVDGDHADNVTPKQQLDELECIEVLAVDVDEALLGVLHELGDEGVIVDSKVLTFAHGLVMGKLA